MPVLNVEVKHGGVSYTLKVDFYRGHHGTKWDPPEDPEVSSWEYVKPNDLSHEAIEQLYMDNTFYDNIFMACELELERSERALEISWEFRMFLKKLYVE